MAAERAQSFTVRRAWAHEGAAPRDALHALFLADADARLARGHSSRSHHLVTLRCDFATLEQSVFPFELVVASGRGEVRDGSTVRFATRVLAVLDGAPGLLASPERTLVTEDGVSLSRWTRVQLEGGAAPRDVTALFARAGLDALEAAHAGDPSRWRHWLVLMAMLDTQGLPVEELLEADVPADEEVRRAECFESGGVMPVWSQRAAGAFRLEVRAVVPDERRFTVRLITKDRSAGQRHQLPAPFDAS
ncbi:MAG: hypothetical protein ACOZQL_23325 [Myxococcota bacterium]